MSEKRVSMGKSKILKSEYDYTNVDWCFHIKENKPLISVRPKKKKAFTGGYKMTKVTKKTHTKNKSSRLRLTLFNVEKKFLGVFDPNRLFIPKITKNNDLLSNLADFLQDERPRFSKDGHAEYAKWVEHLRRMMLTVIELLAKRRMRELNQIVVDGEESDILDGEEDENEEKDVMEESKENNESSNDFSPVKKKKKRKKKRKKKKKKNTDTDTDTDSDVQIIEVNKKKKKKKNSKKKMKPGEELRLVFSNGYKKKKKKKKGKKKSTSSKIIEKIEVEKVDKKKKKRKKKVIGVKKKKVDIKLKVSGDGKEEVQQLIEDLKQPKKKIDISKYHPSFHACSEKEKKEFISIHKKFISSKVLYCSKMEDCLLKLDVSVILKNKSTILTEKMLDNPIPTQVSLKDVSKLTLPFSLFVPLQELKRSTLNIRNNDSAQINFQKILKGLKKVENGSIKVQTQGIATACYENALSKEEIEKLNEKPIGHLALILLTDCNSKKFGLLGGATYNSVKKEMVLDKMYEDVLKEYEKRGLLSAFLYSEIMVAITGRKYSSIFYKTLSKKSQDVQKSWSYDVVELLVLINDDLKLIEVARETKNKDSPFFIPKNKDRNTYISERYLSDKGLKKANASNYISVASFPDILFLKVVKVIRTSNSWCKQLKSKGTFNVNKITIKSIYQFAALLAGKHFKSLEFKVLAIDVCNACIAERIKDLKKLKKGEFVPMKIIASKLIQMSERHKALCLIAEKFFLSMENQEDHHSLFSIVEDKNIFSFLMSAVKNEKMFFPGEKFNNKNKVVRTRKGMEENISLNVSSILNKFKTILVEANFIDFMEEDITESSELIKYNNILINFKRNNIFEDTMSFNFDYLLFIETCDKIKIRKLIFQLSHNKGNTIVVFLNSKKTDWDSDILNISKDLLILQRGFFFVEKLNKNTVVDDIRSSKLLFPYPYVVCMWKGVKINVIEQSVLSISSTNSLGSGLLFLLNSYFIKQMKKIIFLENSLNFKHFLKDFVTSLNDKKVEIIFVCSNIAKFSLLINEIIFEGKKAVNVNKVNEATLELIEGLENGEFFSISVEEINDSIKEIALVNSNVAKKLQKTFNEKKKELNVASDIKDPMDIENPNENETYQSENENFDVQKNLLSSFNDSPTREEEIQIPHKSKGIVSEDEKEFPIVEENENYGEKEEEEKKEIEQSKEEEEEESEKKGGEIEKEEEEQSEKEEEQSEKEEEQSEKEEEQSEKEEAESEKEEAESEEGERESENEEGESERSEEEERSEDEDSEGSLVHFLEKETPRKNDDDGEFVLMESDMIPSSPGLLRRKKKLEEEKEEGNGEKEVIEVSDDNEVSRKRKRVESEDDSDRDSDVLEQIKKNKRRKIEEEEEEE